MEPLSVQTAASLRPLFQPPPDLAQLLAHGRTLGAEVLQTFSGGTVVLGVGGHQVSAQSQVELRAGERIQVLVQGGGDELVLRLLGRVAPPESELVRLLRSVVGEERPVGERLAELARALRAEVATSGRWAGAAAGLSAELEQHVLPRGADGRALRDLLARSGLGQEAQLGELAELVSGAREPARVLRPSLAALASLALLELVPAEELGAEAEAVLRELRPTLERLIGDALASSRRDGGLETFLRSLGDLLARAFHASPGERIARALARRLAELDPRGFAATRTGAIVAHLLGRGSELPRVELARALLHARLADLGIDLKSRLLAALGIVEEGPLREALSRALAGLEAEQLLELARRSAQDWRAWSLPVSDSAQAGSPWGSARLFHRRMPGRGAGGAEEETSHHLVLGLQLTGLGPVRADLWLAERSLALRVRAHRPETLERLRAELALVRKSLAGLREEVHVAVLAASPEEVSVDDLALDIRYLAENPLLDLAG